MNHTFFHLSKNCHLGSFHMSSSSWCNMSIETVFIKIFTALLKLTGRSPPIEVMTRSSYPFPSKPAFSTCRPALPFLASESEGTVCVPQAADCWQIHVCWHTGHIWAIELSGPIGTFASCRMGHSLTHSVSTTLLEPNTWICAVAIDAGCAHCAVIIEVASRLTLSTVTCPFINVAYLSEGTVSVPSTTCKDNKCISNEQELMSKFQFKLPARQTPLDPVIPSLASSFSQNSPAKQWAS